MFQPKIVVGLCLVTLNTLINSIGHLLFRRSAAVELHLPLWRRWRWATACFLIVCISSVSQTVALTLMPVSMLSPFAGVSMIWSIWFGHCGCCGVSERVTATDVALAVVVLFGVALVSVAGAAGARPDLTQEDLLEVTIRTDFLLVWLLLVVVGGIWAFSPLSQAVRQRAPVAAVCISAFLGASASALTQSFAKLAGTAVSLVLGSSASTSPPVWFVVKSLGGLATCAPLDLLLLSRTIMTASLVLAVPLYMSLIVLLVAAAGDVFFHEAAYYTHAQWLAVLAGTGLVVVGVAAIGYTNAERELQRQEEERREGSALSGQHGKDLRGAGGVAALM